MKHLMYNKEMKKGIRKKMKTLKTSKEYIPISQILGRPEQGKNKKQIIKSRLKFPKGS